MIPAPGRYKGILNRRAVYHVYAVFWLRTRADHRKRLYVTIYQADMPEPRTETLTEATKYIDFNRPVAQP